ncbi:putative ATP-dependent RNA helicase DHX35 [Arctopsyche grandis]|uniref:putative ATP-dependent RNA helicase DHX35 n=1 Tax=Arctopsyche grandis TaxID=121162 RepID=UPI00406D796F
MNLPIDRPRFLRPADDPTYSTSSHDSNRPILPVTEKKINADQDSHTNFVYNRFNHLSVEDQRRKLPIFQYRNHILYLLEKFQTLVLVGETGSGKSTQLPQYLLEAGYCNNHGRIVVTGPRVAAAVALATRVAFEQGTYCDTNGTVGYAVSFDNKYGPNTKIKYVTEGILLREMFSDPLLTQYSCIVLDEVHERSQLTDIIMGLVKKIMRKRKNLKVVVSSATMDAEFLRDFFNLHKRKKIDPSSNENATSTSAILSVQGRTHPVDIFYAKDPVPDYIKATIDVVIKIHENEPFGDILAFLTGQDEVVSAVKILRDYAEENNNKLNKLTSSKSVKVELAILPMYGSLPHYEQLKVFQIAGKNCRKVVIATNIAETSITIPGINYVIDCGFHKVRYFDSSVFFDNLVVCPISKANAIQRTGRAGRMAKGKSYRLYSEEDFQNMTANISPEMQRSDLSAIVLQLKALGIDNILRFTFPSPPPAKIMLSAIEVLYALGALDNKGQLTNPLGVNMAEIPLRPSLAKTLCISGEFGCLEEILTIVSMMQVENVFIKPGGGQAAINAKIMKRNGFEVAEGDLITMLNVYDAYLKNSNVSNNRRAKKHTKDWCHKMFLNEKALYKVTEIRSSLEKLVTKKFGIKNDNKLMMDGAKMEQILKCLCAGMFMNACYLHHSGSYKTLRGDQANLYISPNSCLYNAQQPQWLLFSDVQSSLNKTYMKDLIVIQREWLTEFAPHYYKES